MSGKPESEQLEITPELAEEMGKLYGYGLTLGQIAEYYGISRNTFYLKIKASPELDSTLKKGRRKIQMGIGQSLAIKALKGDLGAICFYMKTQMGWSERTRLEFKDLTKRDPMTEEQLREKLKELESRHEPKLRLVG